MISSNCQGTLEPQLSTTKANKSPRSTILSMPCPSIHIILARPAAMLQEPSESLRMLTYIGDTCPAVSMAVRNSLMLGPSWQWTYFVGFNKRRWAPGEAVERSIASIRSTTDGLLEASQSPTRLSNITLGQRATAQQLTSCRRHRRKLIRLVAVPHGTDSNPSFMETHFARFGLDD
jgi:hypothetical protein